MPENIFDALLPVWLSTIIYSLQLTSNIKLFLIGHSMTKIQLSCYLLWTACNCIKITKTFQMYCHPSFIWIRFKIIQFSLVSEFIPSKCKIFEFWETFIVKRFGIKKLALWLSFEPPTHCMGGDIFLNAWIFAWAAQNFITELVFAESDDSNFF